MYPPLAPNVCDTCMFRVPLQRCDAVFFYLCKGADLLKHKFINYFELIEYTIVFFSPLFKGLPRLCLTIFTGVEH